jgi:hypothetical protein
MSLQRADWGRSSGSARWWAIASNRWQRTIDRVGGRVGSVRKPRRKAMSGSYQGACFCGAVEIEVTGQPNAMGYCHCRSCQWWSGGPVNAFTLWAPEAVKVTKGEQHIGTYHKTEVSYRQFCQLCGGHLMTRHPPLSMIDVFASTIPDLAFSPQLHVNYSETVLPIRDGLPKLKDFPKEFGGSGDIVSE